MKCMKHQSLFGEAVLKFSKKHTIYRRDFFAKGIKTKIIKIKIYDRHITGAVIPEDKKSL